LVVLGAFCEINASALSRGSGSSTARLETRLRFFRPAITALVVVLVRKTVLVEKTVDLVTV
jgi:hypothetical protein